MSIKLIATDLDGTLLQSDHLNVSKKNIEALTHASEQGIIVLIATGRTWDVMSDVANQLKVIDYAILSNGAAIYNASAGSLNPLNEIPYELWRPVYRYLKQNHCIVEIYQNGKSYMEQDILTNYKSPYLKNKFIAKLKSHITAVNDVETYLANKNIEKFSILSVPDENYEQIYKSLKNNVSYSVTSSLPGNIEINLKGVNKGYALKNLCKKLNITAEEVMVFGDADNDLEMLEWAKWSFAMENANEKAMKRARYITGSNTEDGVAQAVNKYIFNVASNKRLNHL